MKRKSPRSMRAKGNIGGNVLHFFSSAVHYLPQHFHQWGASLCSIPLHSPFQTVKSYLKGQMRIFIKLLLCLMPLAVLLLAFLPVDSTFEGNFVVSELDFINISNSNEGKLFLKAIRGMEFVEIKGEQTGENKINFLGKLSSKQLSQLENYQDGLIVELPEPESMLIIQSPSKSLALDEMRLREETEVNQLMYNPFFSTENGAKEYGFSFRLHPLPANATSSSSTLRLSVGLEPLRVTLIGYRLPQLESQVDELPRELNFDWSPIASQFEFNLQEDADIYLALPDPKQRDITEWLRGNLQVKDVKLSRIARTADGDPEDEIELSTILKGEVRIAHQKVELEADRFLNLEAPGIERIASLKIHAEEPEGLQVRVSGHTSKITIGLDPDFPVEEVRVNLLNRYLTPEGVIALVSSCAGFLAAFLPTFLESKGDETSNKQQP